MSKEINERKNVGVSQEAVDQMITTRLLDDAKVRFIKTEGGFLSLETEEKKYARVKVLRLFPFTDPNRYISVRDHNDKDREIGVIEDLAAMSEETQKLIHEQLDLYYFTPVITKIFSIKDEYGYAYFHVMTDAGECKFAINMGANAVARLSDTRLLITDLDENRFEVRDVSKLTVKEQRRLDLFM
ncbi:MAG: DUF1854 domain-containing protein [Lachnospiraceae bacterium]|nr:DUF1854 domain-containing protein [Lachnospiraceae bacterium]